MARKDQGRKVEQRRGGSRERGIGRRGKENRTGQGDSGQDFYAGRIRGLEVVNILIEF
jgi:hypothetical protein